MAKHVFCRIKYVDLLLWCVLLLGKSFFEVLRWTWISKMSVQENCCNLHGSTNICLHTSLLDWIGDSEVVLPTRRPGIDPQVPLVRAMNHTLALPYIMLHNFELILTLQLSVSFCIMWMLTCFEHLCELSNISNLGNQMCQNVHMNILKLLKIVFSR